MFLLRVVVGVVFVYHGLPKIRKPDGMATGMSWSKNTVRMLGLLEVLSGLGVILGVLLNWSALIIAIIMLGAMYYKIFKWHVPFSAHDKSGWEFDLLLLVSAILTMTYVQ